MSELPDGGAQNLAAPCPSTPCAEGTRVQVQRKYLAFATLLLLRESCQHLAVIGYVAAATESWEYALDTAHSRLHSGATTTRYIFFSPLRTLITIPYVLPYVQQKITGCVALQTGQPEDSLASTCGVYMCGHEGNGIMNSSRANVCT
jgi:hypothetical protein